MTYFRYWVATIAGRMDPHLIKDEDISDFGLDIGVVALNFELGIFSKPAVVLELHTLGHVPIRNAGLDLPNDMQLLRVAFHLKIREK